MALLEAMAERQVTVDNVRHVLSDTFFVIATQNPVEQHGTYPLPEAQLDRFAMKLRIGYPGRDHELAMLEAAVCPSTNGESVAAAVIDQGELKALQDQVAQVAVGPAVREYLVALAHATRAHRQVTLGLSLRGLLIWQRYKDRLVKVWHFVGSRTILLRDATLKGTNYVERWRKIYNIKHGLLMRYATVIFYIEDMATKKDVKMMTRFMAQVTGRDEQVFEKTRLNIKPLLKNVTR